MSDEKDIELATEAVEEAVEEVVEQFSFKQVLDQGGLVDSKPVRKKVQWERPSDNKKLEFFVFIRKQSFKVFSKFIDKSVVENDMLLGAQMISACLSTDASGKTDLLSYEKACELHPSLAIALINVIHDVNSKKN